MSGTHKDRPLSNNPIILDFDNNALLTALFGAHNENLAQIETALDISIAGRGNRVIISGEQDACIHAQKVLQNLYEQLHLVGTLSPGDIDGAIRMNAPHMPKKTHHIKCDMKVSIRTQKREIKPRTQMQAHYINMLNTHKMCFGVGPAGTGKTYLAVASAAALWAQGAVERIILSRPAVEAGENLGFLPGDMREKVDPYLRPLYDALYDILPHKQVSRAFESGEIEIAPLAFMRGRTLSNSFIILDEAQNTTNMQMKMFLTRMGENSHMVITGDPSQIDLPAGVKSGLIDALEILPAIKDIGFTYFGEDDVIRHSLVTHIVKAYNRRDRENNRKPI